MGRPHSLDESGEQVINNANVLALTDDTVKKNFLAMTNDQKRQGEEDMLKYLLAINYKVLKREDDDLEEAAPLSDDGNGEEKEDQQ